jgi:hypothetical protein
MANFTYARSLGMWTGYSTDTKPVNIDKDTLAYEYDTQNTYIYTGTEWVLI